MIETDTQDNKKVKQPSRPTSMIETDKHDPGHQAGDIEHDRDRRPAKKVAAKTPAERAAETEFLTSGLKTRHVSRCRRNFAGDGRQSTGRSLVTIME